MRIINHTNALFNEILFPRHLTLRWRSEKNMLNMYSHDEKEYKYADSRTEKKK
jgi:hypothetical protein